VSSHNGAEFVFVPRSGLGGFPYGKPRPGLPIPISEISGFMCFRPRYSDQHFAQLMFPIEAIDLCDAYNVGVFIASTLNLIWSVWGDKFGFAAFEAFTKFGEDFGG